MKRIILCVAVAGLIILLLIICKSIYSRFYERELVFLFTSEQITTYMELVSENKPTGYLLQI